MLHAQSVRALELWSRGPRVTDPGFGDAELAELRRVARLAAALEDGPPVGSVRDVDADGVPCRLYLPDPGADLDTGPGPVVYLHGGGFVFGDVDTHDAQARRLCAATGRAVLAVDYRRPPEHRFPAAPDDVDTALAWLGRHGAQHGLVGERAVLVGDSAGGNLALVAALRSPERVAGLVLAYPFLDPDTSSGSYLHEDGGGLGRDEARWYWQQYAAGADDLLDPDLAPLRSTQTRLATLRAPVLVQAAEHDPLLDEDTTLALRLQEAGVDVRLTTYPGMVHGFWRHPELFDAAGEALVEVAGFLRGRQ